MLILDIMTNTIIFDLGAVLIDWQPGYLFSKLFKTEDEAEHFLNTICTSEWNEEQDGGRSLKEATDLLVSKYPEHEANIRAYYDRWDEMLGGPIEGTVSILRGLKEGGMHKIYALTNWSAETFPIALDRYDFLQWFDGIVVSGTERMRKPFPEFYKLLLGRYNVQTDEALFIDDNLRNVEAAKALGIDSIHFLSPEQLEQELNNRNIRVPAAKK